MVVKTGPRLERLAESPFSTTDPVYGVAAVDGAFVVRTGLLCVGKPATGR